jgi:NADPH-dependent F420 reductase
VTIAIIGTGNVGAVLGTRWAKAGHSVVFGSRDPAGSKARSLIKLTDSKASVAGVQEAAADADVVVMATPWSATKETLSAIGNLARKVVVDCTNPIAEGMTLALGHTTSGGEQVAAWARGARVVKAFNTTGANNMANPSFGDNRATMFICGDDTDAKDIVSDLASQLGFEVCDTGALSSARYLEPLAMLWIHLAYTRGMGREFAFKIIKR